MPAIFHVKIEDESFDGAVNHIVEASDDDTVWHCEEAGDNFDGAIFHVKWAEDGHEEPVWRVSGISRGTVTTVGPAVSPLLLPDAIADSLAYVKAYGGTEQRDIPDNYLQRQYIYMLDGSYLLTDIVPTYDGRYEVDFQTTTVNLSDDAFYLGGEIRCGLLHLSSGLFRVIGFGEYKNSAVNVSNNTRYKFVWDNQKATLTTGNTVILDETYTATSSTTVPLGINCYNSTVTPDSNNEGIYLYSFKAWNAQGELVADYVPAVQKGTVPVVGFYDTVSKTFKTATAGTFAAGPDAVPTPDAPIDIVSNNGAIKVSPNLFNQNDVIDGYVSGSTGAKVVAHSSAKTFIIPCKPRTKYTFYFDNSMVSSGRCHISGFNKKPEIGSANIQGIYSSSESKIHNVTFTTGANVHYLALWLIYNSSHAGVQDALKTVVLREGTSTDGIYTNGLTETIRDAAGHTATAEMLLKVGDYADVQSIINGVVTRNVGVKVLTGEENWNLAGSGDALRVDIRTDIGLPPTQDLTSPMICTHYPFDAYFSGGGSTQPGTFNAWNGQGGYFLRFSIVGMDITTVAQWKQFLADQYAAGTPVIVIYPLATATTESVAGQTLQVQNGDNTLEITQASLNGLEIEARYMKGVVTSVEEVDSQGLDNNVSVSLS